jgi:DNA polymerase-3 subunit alpha
MALIIDVETTGLPIRRRTFPNYKDLSKYDSARIVQFTSLLCDESYNALDLYDTIVKLDTNIHISNSQFHGITDDISQTEGQDFDIVADKFKEQLSLCTQIIAHNIEFDINIIKSELFRINRHDIIDVLDMKPFLCTMQHTKHMVNKHNIYGIKYPSLAELYEYTFHEPLQNAHNSRYDVLNLHKIVKYMFDNQKL